MGARVMLLMGLLGAASSVAGLQPLYRSAEAAWVIPSSIPLGHRQRSDQSMCTQRALVSRVHGAQASNAWGSGRACLGRVADVKARQRGQAPYGALNLRSQEQPREGDEDLEQAEAAEGFVQKYVFGGIGAIAALSFAGYCAYSGQSPIEVANQILQTDFKQSMTDLVAYIDGLGPIGYLYFSSVYVVAEMLAIPAIPLAASAGYLFGAVKGTLVVLISATVAASLAFQVGRVALRQWVEKLISGSRKFQAIDEAISRKGFQLVLLLRLSPLLPFSISNYLYGMTKVNFAEYVAGTLIGFAPGTLAFVMTGQVGRELSGGGGGEALPWYGYAAGAAGVVWVGSTVAKIAGNAIAEVEAESEQRLSAAKAHGKKGDGVKDNDIEVEKDLTTRRGG